jgi:hypothetical protein
MLALFPKFSSCSSKKNPLSLDYMRRAVGPALLRPVPVHCRSHAAWGDRWPLVVVKRSIGPLFPLKSRPFAHFAAEAEVRTLRANDKHTDVAFACLMHRDPQSLGKNANRAGCRGDWPARYFRPRRRARIGSSFVIPPLCNVRPDGGRWVQV